MLQRLQNGPMDTKFSIRWFDVKFNFLIFFLSIYFKLSFLVDPFGRFFFFLNEFFIG